MKSSNQSSTSSAAPDTDKGGVSIDHRLDQIAAKWEQQVGSAKVLWGKLTDDELLKTEGKLQRLKGLVQERYALTEDDAEKQVKQFLSKFDS